MHSLWQRHRFLIAFAALSSLMGVSVGLAKVTTSLYAVQLGVPEAFLGLIASSQSLGVLIMSLPLGFLVGRHGPARLFVLGTLIAGSIYAVLPLVPTPRFLLLCTTAIGFFMPFRFVSLNTVFLEQLLTLGESKAGWYRGTHVAGMFLLGPALAAGSVQRLLFPGTYWLIALLFALSVVLCPIVFRQHATTPSSRELRLSLLTERLALLGSDRELRGVCLAEFGAQALHNFYAFFIVVIAVLDLGLSRMDAAGLVTAQGLCYVVALFALGGAAAKLGSQRVYRASCALIALALLVLGTAQRLPLLWLGGSALGLGLGALQIVNLTRFARLGARIGRGETAGMNALVGPAGGLAGSLIGGWLGQTVGLQRVFLVFVPLVALLARQLTKRLEPVSLLIDSAAGRE